MSHNIYMNTNIRTGERGLIKWILLIIIAIVLASYFFDFSVRDAVEDEQTQDNFGYIQTHTVSFWDKHLKSTANYLWDSIFIDLLWDSFNDKLQRIKDGEKNVFEDNSPGVGVSTVADSTNGPIPAGFVETP